MFFIYKCDMLSGWFSSGLKSKVDYLEGQCRGNLSGGWQPWVSKWEMDWLWGENKHYIQEKFKHDPNKVILGRTERTKKRGIPRVPNALVKFLRYEDKETVLKRSEYLIRTNICLNEDFPEVVCLKRGKKSSLLSELPEQAEGSLIFVMINASPSHHRKSKRALTWK